MNQAADHIFEGDHWAQPTTWTTDETTRRLHDTTCATRCCLVKSCGRLEKMMTPTDLRLDNLISSERNFGRMSWRWNVISLHSNPHILRIIPRTCDFWTQVLWAYGLQQVLKLWEGHVWHWRIDRSISEVPSSKKNDTKLSRWTSLWCEKSDQTNWIFWRFRGRCISYCT